MRPSAEDLWELSETHSLEQLAHRGGVLGVAASLGSDAKHGITDPATISSRVANYGTNDIPDRPVRSFYEMLREALGDETLIILMVCAVVSLVLEMGLASPAERATAWIDGTAILAAVAIVSLVQAYSNHKQELQFAAVNRIKSVYDVAVVRGGAVSRMKNTDLVVGDVVLLEQGDRIPADGLCLESDAMKVDQSTANGESEAVMKGIEDPFLISNTHVTEGRGRMLVTCVGLNSHQGRVFELISEQESENTPLQEKLEDLAKKIGYMGVIAASLTFIALVIAWIARHMRSGWSWVALKEPLNFFIVAITIVACAVPEGLPLAVTISLAYSMRRMMSDNNFVRHLSACETMGSATVICTDKTGTLTKNEMNAERLIVGLEPNFEAKDAPIMDLLKWSVSVNSTAVVTSNEDIGSQTECALVRFVGMSRVEEYRNAAHIVKTFQFDRVRKLMSTIEEKDERVIVHVKGAPDELLMKCTNYMLPDRTVQVIDDKFRENLTGLINTECSMAYRTLGVACKAVATAPETMEEAECELTLVAVVSIRDSIRRHAPDAILQCKGAQIRVIMVTGDHIATAQAIAKECHILNDDSLVLTGAELRKMSEDELSQTLPHLAVVARSTPTDKHLLVTALKERGEVVSVTGDGTNDVPALMAADVGLSMGKCGTELAKEASDIVVLDDDFRSIVKSVIWGRCVYNNISRFLQFQLTANVSTLFISFVSAVLLEETPFKAVQLLWVNLIMDSLGALALATGKPHESLLNQKPHDKETPLISWFMINNIAGQSLLQIILIGVIILFPGEFESYSQHHYTFLYNVFVLCQMFNLMNARATSPNDDILVGICDTPLFLGIMFGIGFVQLLLVEVAGPFFSCTPLSLWEWILSLLLSGLTIPVGIAIRRLPNMEDLFTGTIREDNQPLLN